MQNPLFAIILTLSLFLFFAGGKKVDHGKKMDHGEKISWEDYKTKFGKSYPTKELDDAHKAVFTSNQKKVQTHNAKHHRGEKSYTTGLNKHSDLLPSEKNNKGLIVPHTDGKSKRGAAPFNCVTWSSLYDKAGAAPFSDMGDSLDYRDLGWVTPVKDQGQCGCCYVFSSTGALEGQLAKKTGKLTSLSEQNMVDCMSSNGCGGGWMANVFQYVNQHGGIDTEASYPFTGLNNQTCKYNKANVGGTDVGCVTVQRGNETQLMYALHFSPVSIAIWTEFDEFNNFQSSEVFDDPTICNGQPVPVYDHAVLIVGYGTDANGTDYWLIKNSWGTSWGDQGYMKLARGIDCLGVADYAIYPTV